MILPSKPRIVFAALLGLIAVGCGSEVTSEDPGGGGSGATSAGGAGGQGQGGAGAAQPFCNPNQVACNMPAPTCTAGEVPSVEGACWGPCVPILSCAPEASCDDCTFGFCAEYSGWTSEYRCVALSPVCAALACSCLAPYLCVAPYDACVDTGPGDPVVNCGCPAC